MAPSETEEAPSGGRPAFLVNASMPRSSLDVLRKQGYEAIDVRDIGLGGADDDEIIQHAQDEDRIVLTRDTDFGLVLRHPNHPGALILRLPYRYTASQINERLRTFLENVEAEDLLGAIIIVELDRFRRRRLD